MKVYGDSRSGNCYKIQLLLGLLGKQCEWKEVDILNGETQTDAFKQQYDVKTTPQTFIDGQRIGGQPPNYSARACV